MGQLLEIAFVDVEPGSIESLVGTLLPLLSHDRKAIRAFVRKSEDDVLTISPRCTTIGKTSLQDMSARVLRYSGKYDVELAWDLDVIRDEDVSTMVASAHAVAVCAAEAHGVSEYYGGLEPCDHEDTRVFTGRQRGPLILGG